MVPPRDADRGVSLTETMLVLAVGSGILVMSMKMYTQWTDYRDGQLLLANVEQLQSAMHNYYQANCRATMDPSGSGNFISPGKLDPSVINNNTVTTLTLSINGTAAATDLIATGFLSTNSWHPANPWIDSTSGTNQGYYVQFNRIQPTTNTDPSTRIYACPGSSTGAILSTGTNAPATCTGTVPQPLTNSGNTPPLQSRVAHWMSHVGVKLLDTTNIDTLQKVLNATCITTDPTVSCQTPTPTPTPSVYYLIWEQPVAVLTADTTSPLWLSSPQVKQFKMQYTNDGMSSLNGISSSSTYYTIQNYLCGD